MLQSKSIHYASCKNAKNALVDVFKDDGRCFRLWVTNDIEQRNDVWSASEVLQNLDLSLDLLLFDWFEDFDDTFVVGLYVDTFKHFRVLSSPDFAYYLIVVLLPDRRCDSLSSASAGLSTPTHPHETMRLSIRSGLSECASSVRHQAYRSPTMIDPASHSKQCRNAISTRISRNLLVERTTPGSASARTSAGV